MNLQESLDAVEAVRTKIIQSKAGIGPMPDREEISNAWKLLRQSRSATATKAANKPKREKAATVDIQDLLDKSFGPNAVNDIGTTVDPADAEDNPQN